jgi:hypothetical protein
MHGVAPLVSFLLAGRPESSWPAAVISVLRDRAAHAAALHALRMRELTRVLERLAALNIRPVLTKGVVLAHTHYPQPPLRPSFDVDLFVAADDVAAVARLFEDLGYRRSKQVAGSLVMPQFDYEKKCEHGVWHMYDVHFRAVNPHVFDNAMPYEELAEETIPIEPLGPFARGTSPRHALLLACLHRVAHHPGDDRMIWLYDIHLLAGRMTTDELRRFARLAADKSVSGVVGAGLAAARAVFHTALPDGLIDELDERSSRANEASRSFINGHSKMGELWSDLRVVPRWRDRVRLLGQHVFPSSAYMLRRYDARSRALLPALYTHRLFTGAWRWLRNAAS